MFDFSIHVGSMTTQVAVRRGVLHEAGSLLAAIPRRQRPAQVVLVTDGRVGSLYARTVLASLEQQGFSTREHRIEPGEASKCLTVATTLYEFLVHHRVGRDALILALGGGVVSDLAGFVAATWMRGIDFAICPTTLEADIDASIGGKTAINIAGAKNLVGAFHQPTLVAVDPVCLDSLDARDVRAGLAESVKHALISSEALLAWHEANVDAIERLEPRLTRELIERNLRVKAGFVERDARERSGVRIMLNFGHTIGHAIEARSGYALRHGECVSLGMLAACRLSVAMGMLDRAVVARVEELLNGFKLPTTLAAPIDSERIISTIRNDKKVQGGVARYVLLQGIGKPAVRDDIPEAEVRRAYESLLP